MASSELSSGSGSKNAVLPDVIRSVISGSHDLSNVVLSRESQSALSGLATSSNVVVVLLCLGTDSSMELGVLIISQQVQTPCQPLKADNTHDLVENTS